MNRHDFSNTWWNSSSGVERLAVSFRVKVIFRDFIDYTVHIFIILYIPQLSLDQLVIKTKVDGIIVDTNIKYKNLNEMEKLIVVKS